MHRRPPEASSGLGERHSHEIVVFDGATSAGIGLDQVFSPVTQHDFIAEQLARLIINHEDIALVLGTSNSLFLANGLFWARRQ